MYPFIDIAPLFPCRVDSLTKRAQLRAYIGARPDTIVVTVVGTICRRKGQFPLIQALQHVLQQQPHLRARVLLLLIGDTVPPSLESQSIQNFIAQHQLMHNVRLVHKHIAAPELMYASDVHWSNSLAESFPLNVLEAMLLGIPVVSSRVHGIRELTHTDPPCAVVYEPDNMATLIDTLLLVLNDSYRAELRGMADAAYHHVHSHFTAPQAMAHWQRLLLQVTEMPKPGLLSQ
jgi:glycosyltransferase involved in cell wall biosynthesis